MVWSIHKGILVPSPLIFDYSASHSPLKIHRSLSTTFQATIRSLGPALAAHSRRRRNAGLVKVEELMNAAACVHVLDKKAGYLDIPKAYVAFKTYSAAHESMKHLGDKNVCQS